MWGDGSADARLLAAQICGVLWVVLWVAVIMTPYFHLLNALGLFRVDAIEEEVGLDISHHKGAAYDLSGPSEGDLKKCELNKSGRKVEVPVEEVA